MKLVLQIIRCHGLKYKNAPLPSSEKYTLETLEMIHLDK